MVLLWGSNARAAHPTLFHHLLTGLRNGAEPFCVGPRRTDSARFADLWLGLDVGSDVALVNTVARRDHRRRPPPPRFIERATDGFDAFAAHIEPYSLARGEEQAGVPAEAIREVAHADAPAERAQICWTLGITEHHNGVDNVLALIDLALLTGHVGRWGSRLVPLWGQNNVQRGGDMGALPNELPGFADVVDAEARARFEATWGAAIPAGRGEDAELTDVVPPPPSHGRERRHLSNSERRVQRVRPTTTPTPGTRDDLAILHDLAGRLGSGRGEADAEQTRDELRSLSPAYRGMRHERLESLGGLQRPCPDEDHPGTPFLHQRLWAEPREGRAATFSVVDAATPHDAVDDEFPMRLTTGRVLDGSNSGVQSGASTRPSGRARRSTSAPRTPPPSGSPTAHERRSAHGGARSRRSRCGSNPWEPDPRRRPVTIGTFQTARRRPLLGSTHPPPRRTPRCSPQRHR